MKQREIRRLMEGLGFKLIREGRHLVWSDGKITTTTTSVSPSCDRAKQNIIKDVERKRRQAS